jgi:hypothetical protein
MIQRIQSLYLFVVAVACTLLFFFPMIDYIRSGKGTYKLFATGMKSFSDLPGTSFFLANFSRYLSLLLFLYCTSPHYHLPVQKAQTPVPACQHQCSVEMLY